MKIEELLNDALKQLDQEESAKHLEDRRWIPSLFGKCYRKQYWVRKVEIESNPKDERTTRMLACRSVHHRFIQEKIKEKYPQAMIEVPYKDHDVSLRADIVYEDEVIELKTMHSRGFFYMNRKDFLLSRDKKDHIYQVMTNAIKLDKDKCRLVYVDVDTYCMKEFVLPVTGMWANEVEWEIAALNEAWHKEWLPEAKPRLYKQKNGTYKECEYCGFRTKCNQTEVWHGNPTNKK